MKIIGNAEYESITEFAGRHGFSGRYALQLVNGVWKSRGERKEYVKPKMKEGVHYVREGERVWINSRVRVIRGKVIKT